MEMSILSVLDRIPEKAEDGSKVYMSWGLQSQGSRSERKEGIQVNGGYYEAGDRLVAQKKSSERLHL